MMLDVSPLTPSPRRWFLLAAPAFAWSFQEMASFFATSELCRHSGASAARAVASVVSIGAFGLAATSVAFSYRHFRRATSSRASDGDAHERHAVMALVAVLLGVVFCLAIAWGALPVLMLRHVCEARA